MKDPILPVSLKANLSYLIQKSLILRGWGMDEEWNVPKGWIQQNKIPIALKFIIVPLIEFSTESKKKLCVRIVSEVTVRPVNSWTWHGGHFGLTINGGQKKTTLWELNSEWKRSFGSLGNRCTKPEVSRSYDFLNTRWNTWQFRKVKKYFRRK